MYFTIKYSSLSSYDASTPYTAQQMFPFPLVGRFKVRIVGFQMTCLTSGAAALLHEDTIRLQSRALLNPLQPSGFFEFINPITDPSYKQSTPLFSKSGWWEVDLNGAIDIAPQGITFANEIVNAPAPLKFLLHLELEQLK